MRKDIVAQGFVDAHEESCGCEVWTDNKYRRALVDKDTGEVKLSYRIDKLQTDWVW